MEYFKIGTIVNTRGIRGELKIKSETDFQNDRYKQGNTVYVSCQNRYLPFKIKEYRMINNQDIIVFEDHEDINLVEQYKGCELFVSTDSDTTLYEDEYHISEIIGLAVYQENELIGEVHDVLAYPQGDYLEIINEEGKRFVVPFRDEFVIDMDLEEGYIEIVDMEGLV